MFFCFFWGGGCMFPYMQPAGTKGVNKHFLFYTGVCNTYTHMLTAKWDHTKHTAEAGGVSQEEKLKCKCYLILISWVLRLSSSFLVMLLTGKQEHFTWHHSHAPTVLYSICVICDLVDGSPHSNWNRICLTVGRIHSVVGKCFSDPNLRISSADMNSSETNDQGKWSQGLDKMSVFVWEVCA